MRKIFVVMLLSILFNVQKVPLALAFKFTAPVNGTTVEAGSAVKVKVDPESAGVIVGVLFNAYGEKKGWGSGLGSDFVVLPPYNWSFTLPPNYVGTVTINAIGKVFGQKTGEPPQAEVKILVILPPSVTLQGIKVDRTRLYLTKVPAGTKGARFYETERLRVKGQYSDGVERDVSNSATGTIYTSSDEKIAAVDSTGLLTAVAPGAAKITIKNGDKQVVVDVAVDQGK